ncbi:MAG: hypothetical protein ABI409_04045 [Ramlibacter sp.]
MAIREHLQPVNGPVGLASPDGFSWARLVTGVFAMAISLAMSWRMGLIPGELARTQTPQAPQAQQEQTATADLLDRREPEIPTVTAQCEALSPPAAPAQVARNPTTRPPGVQSKRHPLRRASTQAKAKARSDLFAQRKALTRQRAEVRNEYIAQREQVAALTGEDSGSVYLTRLAARQSSAPTNPPAHPHNRSQSNRRTPTRS